METKCKVKPMAGAKGIHVDLEPGQRPTKHCWFSPRVPPKGSDWNKQAGGCCLPRRDLSALHFPSVFLWFRMKELGELQRTFMSCYFIISCYLKPILRCSVLPRQMHAIFWNDFWHKASCTCWSQGENYRLSAIHTLLCSKSLFDFSLTTTINHLRTM